jgi:hypothetical protein
MAIVVLCASVFAVDFTCNNVDSLICLYYSYTPPAFAAAEANAGVTVYFDREYVITDISGDVQGKTVLPNMCNNKAAPPGTELWDFTLSTACDVYMGFNDEFVSGGLLSACTWVNDDGWTEVSGASLTWSGEYLGNTYTGSHGTWYKKNGTNFLLKGQGSPENGAVIYVVLVDAAIGASDIRDNLAIEKMRAVDLSAYPNPFAGNLTIDLKNVKGVAGLQVYDMDGRIVRNIGLASSSAVWDGKDNIGRSVANGIYMIKVKTGNKEIQRKLISVVR